MSPDSSPEPDRFFTVQDARRLVEHFSPELAVSDDKIRRYCREGRIDGQQIDKRWVMTLHALFQAELVPIGALDAYGEVLDIPDGVPEEWATTEPAPDEPGPLERMLAADTAAQDTADQAHLLEQPADDDPALDANVDAGHDEVPAANLDSDGDDELGWVLDDEDDADLAPDRPPAPGLAGVDAPEAPGRSEVWFRRRAVAIAAPLVVVVAAVGAGVTSGDRPSPAQAQAPPSGVPVKASSEQRQQAQRDQWRTTMDAASQRGDYRVAIKAAGRLGLAQEAASYRSAAAETLVRRARAAAERGDLDRAGELVRQSRRYAESDGATRVERRIAEIDRARKARAAKRRRDAARREAARNATPTGRRTSATTPAGVVPSPSSSTSAAPKSPSVTPAPAPSAGGSVSGGSSGSTAEREFGPEG